MDDPDDSDLGEVTNRLFGMLDYLGYSVHLKKVHPRRSQFGFTDSFSITALAYMYSPKPCPIARFVMDSILIYEPPADHLDPEGGLMRTEAYEYIPFETFVWYCAKILEHSALGLDRAIPALPIRGAISFGPAILGKMSAYVNGADAADIAVGPAVIDAHEWETDQNWVGVSIAPESIALLKKDRPEEFERALSNCLLLPWDVPTKSGLINAYAVNFVQETQCERLCKIFSDALEDAPSPSVGAKYLATLRFVEHIQEKKLFPVALDTGED